MNYPNEYIGPETVAYIDAMQRKLDRVIIIAKQGRYWLATISSEDGSGHVDLANRIDEMLTAALEDK